MRTYKLQFNQLLFQFHKCRRKLASLRFQNKNARRQLLLEKRIVRLFEKLQGLRRTIGMGMAAATAVVGLSLANPHTAQAQNFDGPQVNPFSIAIQPDSSVTFPTFADLDGDGDMDMLSGSIYGDLFYYENTGTAGNAVFATPIKNPYHLSPAQDGYFTLPRFIDLDGDGDMDIISGGYYGNFYYYENTGTAQAPDFATPVQNPFGLSAPPSAYIGVPTVVDLDGDGDMDLLSLGGYYGDIFYYYENTGTATAPDFGTPIQNPFGIAPAANGYLGFPAFADLDKDGDVDLLTCSDYMTFNYYENTGSAHAPSFGTPETNPFGLFALPNSYGAVPTFVDIDGDGDMDIMAGSAYGYFTFYKNITPPTGITSTDKSDFKIYPNPVLDQLHITGAHDLNMVNLYSIDGRLLNSTKAQETTNDVSIDFAKYPKGTYLVELHFKDGQVSEKLVSK